MLFAFLPMVVRTIGQRLTKRYAFKFKAEDYEYKFRHVLLHRNEFAGEVASDRLANTHLVDSLNSAEDSALSGNLARTSLSACPSCSSPAAIARSWPNCGGSSTPRGSRASSCCRWTMWRRSTKRPSRAP